MFEDFQRLAVNIKRLRLSQLTVTDIAELHARQHRIEIVTAQSAFIDGYRARSIPLGIFQSVLAERDLTESGKYSGNVWVIWAKRRLADRKRSS
jgi:hypothetical protein